jgi:RNA polymerase sigma factor (sigma-70 family)
MVAATTTIDSAGGNFERLFAQEYRRVVSIAYRITADPAEAEDVAQDVFVRCGRSRLGDSERLRGWLYTAAVHLALNAVRARRRRALREVRYDAPQSAADPADVVERNEQRALVRAALLRLNPRDAQMLALRYGGLSYREIAATLEIEAAQIGTRLARAERAFKREIERETFE